MRVAGIIAEYNPLHNGHIYHINKSREITGCDYIIVVMSGDFTQRGEPAIADKYTRAEWALRAGADLVLELPTASAISSAERFAYGGVKVLAGTGVTDAICFGSENADMSAMNKAAEILANETPAFKKALKEQLSFGKSYPRARYDALDAIGASEDVLNLMSTPNSILGLEYIRFIKRCAPGITPVAIDRIGGSHLDASLKGKFSSAAAIREALITGNMAAQDSMPMYVYGRFALGAPPVSIADAQALMLYALKTMNPEQYSSLPDVREGFENVLARAAKKANTLDELFDGLKSKRYTMARCRRIALSAMLKLNKALSDSVMADDALYLRVLGFKQEARGLISAISKRRTLPLISRRSDIAKCSEKAAALIELDVLAHSIYALISAPENPNADFSGPPTII